MIRNRWAASVVPILVLGLSAGPVDARGFGGGARGGGGGGFRGGSVGVSRGGYGGMSHMSSGFSEGAGRSAGGYGGYSGRNPYSGSGMSTAGREYSSGAYGGSYGAGARTGTYDTARGGTVNYGAAAQGARGPNGGGAARGAYGIQGTTAGGRSYSDYGRAGGAVGPGGVAVAGRQNVGGVSGPNGTAIRGESAGVASGPGGIYGAHSSYGAAGVGGYGAHGYGAYGSNVYGGYHSGWVHGAWNGNNSAAWGWRSPYLGAATGFGLGMGLGWGLSSWGYGSSLYGLGYMPYSNPYYGAGVGGFGGGPLVAGAGYDYSQPLDTMSAPVAESVSSPAMSSFDAARAAFQQGDYNGALQQTDLALKTLPNDVDIQEFRGLCLFAIGRYDEAAATLYAVISVGPGWDWTTLISLYADPAVYTSQLRALENFCRANPTSASARFVLAYQYLSQGSTDAAVGVLKQVVALNPQDALSSKLLRQLDPSQDPAAPAVAPTDPTPPAGASIAGTWTANPAPGTSIGLTIQPDGKFAWNVQENGKTQQFSGSSTFGDGLLTLAQASGPALVGRVAWNDPNHMTFKINGEGPADPGLSFSK